MSITNMFFVMHMIVLAAGGGLSFDLAPLNNCGPIALQVCAAYVGADVRGDGVERAVLRGDGQSCTLFELNEGARVLGLHTIAARWTYGFPDISGAPGIICISRTGHDRHFVAAVSQSADKVLIVDLPHRPSWIDLSDLRCLEEATSTRRVVFRCCAAGLLALFGAWLLFRPIMRLRHLWSVGIAP